MLSRLPAPLVLAALLGLAASGVGAAHAQGLPPIYFGIIKSPDGLVVKFVLSKPFRGKQQFDPTDAFIFSPRREKGDCNQSQTKDLRIPEEYKSRPVYDPGDPEMKLSIDELPEFFAIVVSTELTRKGYTKTPEDTLPYHACTRLVWDQLLAMRRNRK